MEEAKHVGEGRFDVLEVWDRHIERDARHLRLNRSKAGSAVLTLALNQSREARAAVEGLLKSNRALIDRHDEDAKLVNFDRCGCSVCIELRPALARFMGEGS